MPLLFLLFCVFFWFLVFLFVFFFPLKKAPGGLKAARLHTHLQQQGLLLFHLQLVWEVGGGLGERREERKHMPPAPHPQKRKERNPTTGRSMCQA